MLRTSLAVLACAIVVALAAARFSGPEAARAGGAAPGGGSAPGIALPDRSPYPSAPASAPDLPERLMSIPPETVTLTGRRGSGTAASRGKHVVSRTSERVHLALPDGNEWLFARNAIDPRRASGVLVHHERRALIEHEESDLRNWLGIRGWADVLALGDRPATPGPDRGPRLEVIGARPGVDPELMRPPAARFPTYRVLDLAEWLER